MSKKLIVDRCDQCRYFDNFYYDFNEFCKLSKKKVERTDRLGEYDIPDFCKLDDAEENTKNETGI